MRSKFFLVSIFTLAVILYAAGCDFKAKEKTGRDEIRPNIVMILIDALRRDHMSCYGYERRTSPFMDSLAEEGLLFENAIAQAPWTAPSIASIFTSRYPMQIGVGAQERPGEKTRRQDPVTSLGKQEATLAELLNENGYRTGNITANPFLKEKFGMTQGFEYNKYHHFAKADVIIDAAIEYLKHGGKGMKVLSAADEQPFFLYLHIMDVHSPNNPPPPYDALYPTLDSAPHEKRHYAWKHYNDAENLGTQEFKIYKSHKIALYDGGLTFLDSHVKRFVDYLKGEGLYENTVIVIVADHGTEMWDHALFEKKFMDDIPDDNYGVEHAHTLFRELLNVPLIFYGKDVPGRRVTQQVRNIDIMPTLLGLAGIKNEVTEMEGIDLFNKLSKNKLQGFPAFSEEVGRGYEKKSLQDDRYKYIKYTAGRDKEFLFDKKNDPFETVDVSRKFPEITKRFRNEFGLLLSTFDQEEERPVVIDEKTREQLRSLGYLQ